MEGLKAFKSPWPFKTFEALQAMVFWCAFKAVKVLLTSLLSWL
jgi:hypothetical protein